MIRSLGSDMDALPEPPFHINPVMVMVIKGNFTNFAAPRAELTRISVSAENAQAFYTGLLSART